jgi:uncharacterized protein
MARLILILAVVGGLWWLLSVRSRPRGDRGSDRSTPSDAAPATGPKTRPNTGPDTMVACAHCDLHLPRSEAVVGEGGALFCSAAHAQSGARPPEAHP